MYYITVRQKPKGKQISLEDILFSVINESQFESGSVSGTITHMTGFISPELLASTPIAEMSDAISEFVTKYAHLYTVERKTLYRSFSIPKKSGGLRRIDAPNDELMTALRELKDILEQKCGALYHTSAYAYVPGRSTIDAVRRHQSNASYWFLKTDFSNFFGSVTLDFTIKMLEKIFPFNELLFDGKTRTDLINAISLCFLNGGLPQGTPISPMLTNLIMIPIDHMLCNELAHSGFTYSRYADDILISSRKHFMYVPICQRIDEVLRSFDAPFRIKPSKTRFGSRAGSNWNLGVMLNKDNNVTVGHRVKHNFKITMHRYITDKKNGVNWPIEDVQEMHGLLSYYFMVEPRYFHGLIDHMNAKHNCDFRKMLKKDLSVRSHA